MTCTNMVLKSPVIVLQHDEFADLSTHESCKNFTVVEKGRFRAVPEIILRGGWAAGTFLSFGGRVFY